MQPSSETLNLEQVVDVLRRRVAWIVLCVLVVAAAAYGFSEHETKKYEATASLTFTNNSLSQQIAGLSGSGFDASLLSQQESNVELVRLGNMAAQTARLLGKGLTAGQVGESLKISTQGESTAVDVTATSSSPALAAAIANAYSKQFIADQQAGNRAFFKAALALTEKQLAALSPAQQLGDDGLNLQTRAQTLTLLAELHYGNAQLAQEAAAPASPSSPRTARNTLIGALLGLLLGFGVAFLVERLDRRIRDPEDLEAIYGLPLLGVVPETVARSQRRVRGRRIQPILAAAEAEVFGLIRARLRFFNVDRDLRTVVIASPSSADGKTTVARNLAAAAARLRSRVLLVEVDLRHPALARKLGLAAGPGLADVLAGAATLEQATQAIELHAAPGGGGAERTLHVLTAGAVPLLNPGELIESSAMDELLEQARSIYDLVVIDTPPLIAVSDAFALLRKVDGVVVVGWVRRSRRDAAKRLNDVLAGTSAPVLGVIAIDSKPDDSRGRYSYVSDVTAYADPSLSNGHARYGRLVANRED